MSTTLDPPEQHQILENPSQLYDQLTAWCYTPVVLMDSDTAREWTELLSTKEFTSVTLEDTPGNLTGLLRAFNAFPYDDELNAARQAIKSFSITVKDPSEQEKLLSQVISGMTGLQIISLDPKPFTVSDGRQFYDAILDSPERPIWWEMYSIRIRGANVLGACIIGRSNYRTLKFVDIDGWITSSGCEKMEAKIEFDNVRKGMERISITRLAFHFDYRRFSPRIIRCDLGKEMSSRPLSTHRIKQWYTKWIEYLTKGTCLEEVWIFAHSSLAYVGTLDDDEKVTVRCRELGDEPKQGFPWGLHEE
ncbi:hypothetical protein ACHAPD_001703 [Fusarium lateritium]